MNFDADIKEGNLNDTPKIWLYSKRLELQFQRNFWPNEPLQDTAVDTFPVFEEEEKDSPGSRGALPLMGSNKPP